MGPQSRESLVFNRNSGQITLNAAFTYLQDETVTITHGIIGVITLSQGTCNSYSGDYLIIMTAKEKVASIAGCDIFKMTGYRIIPVHRFRQHPNVLLLLTQG
jgi:hypothetical protein